MKYAILIPRGGSDEPPDTMDDSAPTPLESAAMPACAAIAAAGRVALVRTILSGQQWGDAASGLLGLLDADSGMTHDRRVSEASLLAAHAMGGTGWAYSLGWLATQDRHGQPSAADDARVAEWDESTLSDAESAAMWADISAAWREAEPALAADLRVEHHGGRWVLIDTRHDHEAVASIPPWRLIGDSWRAAEPGGGDVDAAWSLRRFMHVGSGVLATHDVNVARHERGLPLVTIPWPWGAGRVPKWRPFAARFGVRGVMVTDDPLAAAVARALGMDLRLVASDSLGDEAVDALGSVDLVCVVAAGPMLASLAGDADAKRHALETFDASAVAPVAARLRDFGDPESDADARGWRLLVAPDTVWPVGDPEPLDEPVPALLAGAWIRSMVRREYHERAAADADLKIADPSGLLEFVLLGGLAGAKAVGRKSEDAGTLWETTS